MITPPLSISAMPRLTRAVPSRLVGGVGLVISDTVKSLLIAVFPTEPAAARTARNDAFVPRFRCALDCLEVISTTAPAQYGERSRPPPIRVGGMTQPHHMSQPTEAWVGQGHRAARGAVERARGGGGLDVRGAEGQAARGARRSAGSTADDMIFKLAGQDQARALGLVGAHLFEPMAGRPMKAWVQVPSSMSRSTANWLVPLKPAWAPEPPSPGRSVQLDRDRW